jgi:hypothetical protein
MIPLRFPFLFVVVALLGTVYAWPTMSADIFFFEKISVRGSAFAQQPTLLFMLFISRFCLVAFVVRGIFFSVLFLVFVWLLLFYLGFFFPRYNTALTIIRVDQNRWTDIGATALARALRTNVGLTDISVWGAVRYFSDYLFSPCLWVWCSPRILQNMTTWG